MCLLLLSVLETPSHSDRLFSSPALLLSFFPGPSIQKEVRKKTTKHETELHGSLCVWAVFEPLTERRSSSHVCGQTEGWMVAGGREEGQPRSWLIHAHSKRRFWCNRRAIGQPVSIFLSFFFLVICTEPEAALEYEAFSSSSSSILQRERKALILREGGCRPSCRVFFGFSANCMRLRKSGGAVPFEREERKLLHPLVCLPSCWPPSYLSRLILPCFVSKA